MESSYNSDDCSQMASVYELLSRLWLEEIELELLNALSQDEMRAAYEHLGGCLPDEIDQDTVDELAVDYCQILIGPQGQISPVQSVWENQALEAEAASSMRKYFELMQGFEPIGNIPDHFGVQLQFMGELFQHAADNDDGEAILQIADDFFQKHLSWTNPFLDAVSKKAETDFYIGLANLTSNFLNLEPSEY